LAKRGSKFTTRSFVHCERKHIEDDANAKRGKKMHEEKEEQILSFAQYKERHLGYKKEILNLPRVKNGQRSKKLS
jgi:hypothetical protein